MGNCQTEVLFEAGLSEGGNPRWNSPSVTRMSGPKSEGDDGKAYTSCVSRDSTIFAIDDLKHLPPKMGTEVRPDCRPRA